MDLNIKSKKIIENSTNTNPARYDFSITGEGTQEEVQTLINLIVDFAEYNGMKRT